MSADNHAGKSAGTYLLASCKILALSKNSRLPFIRPKAGALLAYQTRFEVYVWAPTRRAAERPRDQLILSQKSRILGYCWFVDTDRKMVRGDYLSQRQRNLALREAAAGSN